MNTKNEFPRRTIRQPTRKVSNFKGSLWDDMDTVPFEYKNHYEHSLDRMGNYDMWRHNKLWPEAHSDIYGASKPKAPADSSRKSFLGGFLDELKSSDWQKQVKRFESAVGGYLGGQFSRYSWKKIATIGAATGVGYGVGVFSTRKANPNDDKR